MVLGTWLIGRASFELMFYNYWRVAPSLFELLVIIDIFPTKILTLVGMLKMMMMMMVMMTMVMMMISKTTVVGMMVWSGVWSVAGLAG